jgi:hypothetical protein
VISDEAINVTMMTVVIVKIVRNINTPS